MCEIVNFSYHFLIVFQIKTFFFIAKNTFNAHLSRFGNFVLIGTCLLSEKKKNDGISTSNLLDHWNLFLLHSSSYFSSFPIDILCLQIIWRKAKWECLSQVQFKRKFVIAHFNRSLVWFKFRRHDMERGFKNNNVYSNGALDLDEELDRRYTMHRSRERSEPPRLRSFGNFHSSTTGEKSNKSSKWVKNKKY